MAAATKEGDVEWSPRLRSDDSGVLGVKLATTGSNVGTMLPLSALLFLIGAALVAGARKRGAH